jgi:hypothetical protein
MLKARMTAEQIQLREGLEPTLVANEIARAVALGEGLPETFFDYGCVPQESRAEVYELTKSVKDARGRHLAVIVEIGGTLRRAKELLGHGNFLPWLKAEFRWSERTARNYMSLAAHFQDKTANFADLDLGTARELIDSPAEVSEPIMRRAEAGETIGREEVNAAVRINRARLRSRHATTAASRKARQFIAIVVRRAANQRAAAVGRFAGGEREVSGS